MVLPVGISTCEASLKPAVKCRCLDFEVSRPAGCSPPSTQCASASEHTLSRLSSHPRKITSHLLIPLSLHFQVSSRPLTPLTFTPGDLSCLTHSSTGSPLLNTNVASMLDLYWYHWRRYGYRRVRDIGTISHTTVRTRVFLPRCFKAAAP